MNRKYGHGTELFEQHVSWGGGGGGNMGSYRCQHDKWLPILYKKLLQKCWKWIEDMNGLEKSYLEKKSELQDITFFFAVLSLLLRILIFCEFWVYTFQFCFFFFAME